MKSIQVLAIAAFTFSGRWALAHDPVQAAAQTAHHDRPEDSIFKTNPLRGGVYALYGRGGNVGFVVGPEYAIVVDSQFKDIAPGILRQVAKVTDKPVRFLVNTHHHGDHTGGNDAFKPVSVIVAHENVRKRMLKSPEDLKRDLPGRIEAAKAAGQAERVKQLEDALAAAKAVKVEEIAAPIVTFEAGVKLHIGGETLHVVHTPPAHTDGDSFVFFEKANVLHMGDLLFNKWIPFIDTGSGGSAPGYVKALDQAIAYVPADAIVIPGHGDVTDIAGLKAARQYIADLLAAAQAGKSAGKTKEQFLAEVDLAAYREYNGYKDRFKSNAAAAWDGLK
jgi:glyoxylase-like metal-dependent hydrolase (beta-lactamase superfamily II)